MMSWGQNVPEEPMDNVVVPRTRAFEVLLVANRPSKWRLRFMPLNTYEEALEK